MQDPNQPFNPFNQPQPSSPPDAQPQMTPPAPTPTPAPLAPVDPLPQQPAPQPFQPAPPTPDLIPAPGKKGPSKIVVIVLIVVALLLAGGGAAAYFLLSPKGNSANNNVSNSAQDAATTNPADKEAITASSATELKQVCNGKKISNAVTLSGDDYAIAPYIALKGEWALYGITGKYVDSMHVTLDDVNTILCMAPDESTATAAKTCSVKDFSTGATFTIDIQGVTYDAVFYNAQTGEKLSESRVVASNETCPPYAKEGTTEALASPAEVMVNPAFDALFDA